MSRFLSVLNQPNQDLLYFLSKPGANNELNVLKPSAKISALAKISGGKFTTSFCTSNMTWAVSPIASLSRVACGTGSSVFTLSFLCLFVELLPFSSSSKATFSVSARFLQPWVSLLPTVNQSLRSFLGIFAMFLLTSRACSISCSLYSYSGLVELFFDWSLYLAAIK